VHILGVNIDLEKYLWNGFGGIVICSIVGICYFRGFQIIILKSYFENAFFNWSIPNRKSKNQIDFQVGTLHLEG